MCFTCTLEAVTGKETKELEDGWTAEVISEIEWPELTLDMCALARLRFALYETTSATTGGPVHIFTDDYNVEDSNIEFCAKAVDDEEAWYSDRDDWYLVQAISRRIVELARPMSEAERCVALSLSWGELRVWPDGKIRP